MQLDVKKTIEWLQLANTKIQEKKDYLTSLDQPIGDGDHGINMARGFKEVEAKISGKDYKDISELLKDVAMTLMAKVGGASGPLFGTAFLKLSTSIKGEVTINVKQFANALDAAVTGLKQRGKAEEGEKTMIDMWAPIAKLFQHEEGITADKVVDTAKNGVGKNEGNESNKRKSGIFQRKIGRSSRSRRGFKLLYF
jgi:phosphoenolpyruvate---glycerone phosphotransferase subunit DhaL